MMRSTLRLDFATTDASRSHVLGRTLLLLGICLLGTSATLAEGFWSARSRAVAGLEELGEHSAARSRPDATPAKPDLRQVAHTRAARQVAGTLTTPWSDLLASLSAAPNKSVALLSVEPSAAKHSVRLTAEARDLNEMLAYLAALQRDARLSSVVLLTHQLQVQAPGTPVRFQVQAQWGESS